MTNTRVLVLIAFLGSLMISAALTWADTPAEAPAVTSSADAPPPEVSETNSAVAWIVMHWDDLLAVVLMVIGGASVIVAGIAPLTRTKADDRVARALKALHAILSRVALNPKGA